MKRFVLKKEPVRKPEYAINYASLLNEAQLEAVMHDEGPGLVIAGAGTGKTRTLIYRVARLIEAGADPNRILLLTFTRRAAREMLDRASSVLDERCRKVRGGTFHFYCSQLLHQYHEQAGYPQNFTIIDTADAQDLLHMLRAEFKFDKLKTRFPKKSTLQNIISASINRQQSLYDIVESGYDQFLGHIERIETLADAYRQYKEQHRVMDFDDMLVRTVELLQNETVLEQVRGRHEHVLVDEYQDTNAIQAELVRLFTPANGRVMVVGDDAQSIYRFRGADHKNIMRFPDLFKGAKRITLEENYRSTGNILQVANKLLEQAREKYEKKLYSMRETGDLPALVKTADTREQSRFVVQMIMNLREQEISLGETAVLFRNSRDSFDLEIELNRRKIPFIKYGGQKFSEAAHIKDVLAHLRVVINPADALAWNRVLTLIDGIGPKTAADLLNWLESAGNPYELASSGILSDKFKTGLLGLSQLLIDLKQNELTPAEALSQIHAYYKPVCEKKFDDHPKRLKDLEAFEGIAVNYRDYAQLLEELALDPIEATAVETEPGKEDEAPLVLSTIHSAKGLEWSHVFLIQCLDGVIPSGYSVDDPDEIDEELRLLYVAVTRAKDMLYISYPVLQHGSFGDVFTKPSRFLEGMGEQLLEPWLLVDESELPAASLPSASATALPATARGSNGQAAGDEA
ncbi:MAG: ATP-dependent helicase [Candidatus Cyclonatronum sp.]|uniref:ATP-dependent helicase n=1 Tax=Cyclonatronum sp. TaxID=3024185 RepID=UPI0025C53443|nr:ATP-dependent helicase [Cyclonatronum sp.]MCH8486606.1 ATP-dependent helicase [Cyclonatronum sp.]